MAGASPSLPYTLYAERKATRDTAREGLVFTISVPPKELEGDPVQLIVVENTALLRQHWKEALKLAGMFPLMPPLPEALTEVGLRALGLEKIPADQLLRWETEIEILKAHQEPKPRGFYK